MYNLKQKNAASINNPDEGEKTLFLDVADNKLKTKDEDGVIEEISIANPDTPKVYKALLTQAGTDAPVATVLENTLGGTVVWSRTAIGEYIGTLVGAFPDNKTSLGNGIDNAGITILEDYANVQRTTITRVSANELKVLNLDSLTPGAAGVDGIYSPAFISIEVYP